jgi:integrase
MHQLAFDFDAPIVPVLPDDRPASTAPMVEQTSRPGSGRARAQKPKHNPTGEADVPEGLPADFAGLEAQLRRREDQSRKTADMRSALRTVGKVLGLPLEQVPTDPAKLGLLLNEALPMVVGVSPARWSRVKSLTLSALVAAGSEVLPGRDLQGLSPLWQALVDQLPDKRSKIGLSRLLSFLSRQGVCPKDVTAAHLEAFGEALKARSLRIDPIQTFRSSVRIWNRVSASVEAWPTVTLEMEPDRRLYALPIDQFPSSFWADVEGFQANASNPDPFSDNYCRAVRPSTLDARRKQIHQVASALVATGFPIQQVTGLKVLVQPDNARAALRYLLDRRAGKLGEHLEGQARLLVTVARHWVRDPAAAEALARMSKGLHVKKQGMTPRNRERLRQFDLPQNVDALIGLPLRIFEELGRTKTPTPEQALRAMHAVAIELLLHVPVRIGNLTQTEIGKNLLEVRRGKERRYQLVFSTAETKNSEPVEAEISLQSAELLEHYMKHFRQVLGEPGSNRLFTGARREDGVRASGAFSTSLTEFILKETGLNMHMHLFRHLAGYFYLARNPDDIETVRRLLGHRSTATTLRSYASLRTDLAFRRYDALIAERRSEAQISLPKGSRKGRAH